MHRYSIAALLCLLLSACNFEPRYQRPCMDIPCNWRIESDESTTACNFRWWEAIGDPVLNDLILTALANNKDLQVAAWRVCEFMGNYQVVRSPLFPQVNFEAEAAKEGLPRATTPLPPGRDPITPFYAYEFNASWEIDLWGLVRSQAHAAFAEWIASVENRRAVILSLVSAVAQAYVVLRELDRELEISFATLEERREYLRLATLRFEGGLTSEMDVAQAAIAFEQALAAVTILEEQIPQQENLISVLIGQSPTCIYRGNALSNFNLPCDVPTGLPSEILTQRPDVRSAEDLLIAANAEIGAARAAFFPQITLTAMTGAESLQLKDLFLSRARAWRIGADLLQPLFTGWRLTGQLNVAWAQRQQAMYTYEQTVLTAFQEVNDALIALRQNKELVKVQEGQVSAAREYLKLAFLQYYNGQTDYLTVLNAETYLFDAQIDLAQAQGAVFIAFVNLYKALGGGWVIDADCCLRPQ